MWGRMLWLRGRPFTPSLQPMGEHHWPIERPVKSGLCLIPNPRKALVLADQNHNIEDARRDGATGECNAQRLRHLTELQTPALGKGANGAVDRRHAPVGKAL